MLIIGLGNAGPRHEGTRHNIGAAAVAELACLLKMKLKPSGPLGAWVASKGDVALARPNAFMNVAGPSVARVARAFGVSAPLIVSDDLDLALGVIRFRTKGSAGGHKGLASIIASLGTNAFPRLKIGIGRPAAKDDARDRLVREYVLDKFTGDENETYKLTIQRAAEALRTTVTQGLDRAMTAFSK